MPFIGLAERLLYGYKTKNQITRTTKSWFTLLGAVRRCHCQKTSSPWCRNPVFLRIACPVARYIALQTKQLGYKHLRATALMTVEEVKAFRFMYAAWPHHKRLNNCRPWCICGIAGFHVKINYGTLRKTHINHICKKEMSFFYLASILTK